MVEGEMIIGMIASMSTLETVVKNQVSVLTTWIGTRAEMVVRRAKRHLVVPVKIQTWAIPHLSDNAEVTETSTKVATTEDPWRLPLLLLRLPISL